MGSQNNSVGFLRNSVGRTPGQGNRGLKWSLFGQGQETAPGQVSVQKATSFSSEPEVVYSCQKRFALFHTVIFRNTCMHTANTTTQSIARIPICMNGTAPSSAERIASMAKLRGLTDAIARSQGGITL